jgi:hypothetical protein
MQAQSASHPEGAKSNAIAFTRRSVLATIFFVLLAAIIITGTFLEGQRRGMDHTIEALENHQWTIAIALSDLVYHLNAGYVGYATVHNKLTEIWYRGASNVQGPIIRERNKDRDLMNEAIRAAASLGPQRPGFVGDRSLITMVYSDIGSVDFDKLAFRIFGLRIEAFYHTFFLLLTISALAYLIVFWSDLLAKIVLLCALFSFFIELHTSVFTPEMPTFPGMRHGSTLALVPALYFTFTIIRRRPLSVATGLASLVQLAILLLAIDIRGSAAWALAFVPAVSLGVALVDRQRHTGQAQTWQRVMRNAARWPVLLLLGGFLLHNQYMKLVLHPVYFTDDVLPYHGFWHSAYVGMLRAGLDGMPRLIPGGSRAPEVARTSGTDAAGYVAATEYLRDTHFIPPPPLFSPSFVSESFISPWTGTLKFKFDNDIMRRVVMRIWARHPFLSLKLYAVYNPRRALEALSGVIVGTPNRICLWLLMLGGLTAFAITWIAGRGTDVNAIATTLLPVTAALPFAALPNIWGYTELHTIADLLLVSLIFLQLVVCACAILIAYAARIVWSKRFYSRSMGETKE